MKIIYAIVFVKFLVCVESQQECRGEGDFCGGIAGFQCCTNQQLVCKLDSNNPDAGGECVENCSMAGKFCGGIAGIQCCKNQSLVCQLDGSYPDSGGKCAKTCRQKGEKCGSEDCNKCCNGLKCKFNSNKEDCGICSSYKTFTQIVD